MGEVASEEVTSYGMGVVLGHEHGDAVEAFLLSIDGGGEGVVGPSGPEGHYRFDAVGFGLGEEKGEFTDFVAPIGLAGEVVSFDIELV